MDPNAAQAGSDILLHLGVGGIFAILIIREVLGFLLKNRRNGNGGGSSATTADQFKLLRHIDDQVKDLHSWHDAKDEDQVFVWYVRKSLERQIERLCTAVETMTKATESQSDAFESAMTAVLDELQALRKTLPAPGGDTGG